MYDKRLWRPLIIHLITYQPNVLKEAPHVPEAFQPRFHPGCHRAAHLPVRKRHSPLRPGPVRPGRHRVRGSLRHRDGHCRDPHHPPLPLRRNPLGPGEPQEHHGFPGLRHGRPGAGPRPAALGGKRRGPHHGHAAPALGHPGLLHPLRQLQRPPAPGGGEPGEGKRGGQPGVHAGQSHRPGSGRRALRLFRGHAHHPGQRRVLFPVRRAGAVHPHPLPAPGRQDQHPPDRKG